jgi:hypothetical protein
VINPINRVARLRVLVLVMLIAACNAYGSKPTPSGTSTPRPTLLPEATVGALRPFDAASLGFTMVIPENWKPALNADNLVLSPSGTADTSSTAEPFLYVIYDAAKVLPSKITFNFRSDITDPVEQLNLLMEALMRTGPKFDRAQKYNGAHYPAAITTGFERDNQLIVVLMNAGNNRWIYAGAQSIERYFSYYETTVFRPALNALEVK